jgi:hypothetical protein
MHCGRKYVVAGGGRGDALAGALEGIQRFRDRPGKRGMERVEVVGSAIMPSLSPPLVVKKRTDTQQN